MTPPTDAQTKYIYNTYMAIQGLSNLCTPSKIYLIISAVALVVMLIQNFGRYNTYCLGNYSCEVTNTTLIFIVKIVFILFWTWILNLICRAGATPIAWVLVLMPFVLMFFMVASLMAGY
jgi:hypothetical protein